MSLVTQLDAAVRTVCPIHGVSIGRKDDKTTWRIDFVDDATPQQRTAAQALIDGFVVNPANDAIEARIAALYDDHDPIRGFTELAWAIAQIRDVQDAQITALVGVIRQIGGPSFATFDVQRVPDLKLNKGMQDSKAIIDLRKQKT